MDLEFPDVDCGEWSPGHRLVVRGLREDGFSDDSMLADYSEHHSGKPVEPMVSVVYAIVPGLTADELRSGYDMDPTVTFDPPVDAQHWGNPTTMGGEQNGVPADKETTGAFGPFVLPQQTRRIIMELTPDWVTSRGVGPETSPPELMPSGQLTIDLQTQSASFTFCPSLTCGSRPVALRQEAS